MKYQIKRWDSGELIYEGDGESLREVVEQANANKISLAYADLTDADLTYADLTRADLSYADLTRADLDFSSWPLWCGSIGVILDRRQLAQLAYHAMCNMPSKILREFCADPVAFANSFHRAGEVMRIEEEEDK